MAEYGYICGFSWNDGPTVQGMWGKMGLGEPSDRNKYCGEGVGQI